MYVKEFIYADNHGYPTIVEANVIVTDGKYEVMCWYYDIHADIKVGMPISEIYESSWDDYDCIKNNDKMVGIKKDESSFFAYILTGEIVDIEKNLIKIGELIIRLLEIPKSMNTGDYITVKVDRLDCEV